MLILSRKPGQRVMIDHDIEIVVLPSRHSDLVRLGFLAPREVAIHRREVYDAIQKGPDDAAA